MNNQELIKKYEEILINGKSDFKSAHIYKTFLRELRQLDEPEAGHADEAPRYVKNILARLRELPLHDREVWLKTIMGEFEQDFSRAKWREGYEQGKVEGLIEREKVQVPQFVADWIDNMKCQGETLYYGLDHTPPEEVDLWFCEDEVNRQNTFARAWLDGYTVEEEKRYLVKMKGLNSEYNILTYIERVNQWLFSERKSDPRFYQKIHTRKELEKAGFGWVFDCPGIEIEEVEG